MKIPQLAVVFLLVVAPGFAKSLLTATEWKHAGLDRLTADELGVIDAALIRREAGLNAQKASAAIPGQPAPNDHPHPACAVIPVR